MDKVQSKCACVVTCYRGGVQVPIVHCWCRSAEDGEYKHIIHIYIGSRYLTYWLSAIYILICILFILYLRI